MPNAQNILSDVRGSLANQTSAILPSVIAFLLGLFIVGVVGFSHIEVVHNATHDVRTANGFPCH